MLLDCSTNVSCDMIPSRGIGHRTPCAPRAIPGARSDTNSGASQGPSYCFDPTLADYYFSKSTSGTSTGVTFAETSGQLLIQGHPRGHTIAVSFVG